MIYASLEVVLLCGRDDHHSRWLHVFAFRFEFQQRKAQQSSRSSCSSNTTSMSRYSSSMSRHSTLSSGAGPATVLRNDCVLYLTVLSARDLKSTQKIGVQDPYCVVYLVSGGKAATEPTFKTSTHDNGGGLRFDEDVVVVRLVYVCFVWGTHWHLGCRYVGVCRY